MAGADTQLKDKGGRRAIDIAHTMAPRMGYMEDKSIAPHWLSPHSDHHSLILLLEKMETGFEVDPKVIAYQYLNSTSIPDMMDLSYRQQKLPGRMRQQLPKLMHSHLVIVALLIAGRVIIRVGAKGLESLQAPGRIQPLALHLLGSLEYLGMVLGPVLHMTQ